MRRLGLENLEQRLTMSASPLVDAEGSYVRAVHTGADVDVDTMPAQSTALQSSGDPISAVCLIDTAAVWDDTDIVHVLRNDAEGRTSVLQCDTESDAGEAQAHSNRAVFSAYCDVASYKLKNVQITSYQFRADTGCEVTPATNRPGGQALVANIAMGRHIEECHVDYPLKARAAQDGDPNILDMLAAGWMSAGEGHREGMGKKSILLPAVQLVMHSPGDDLASARIRQSRDSRSVDESFATLGDADPRVLYFSLSSGKRDLPIKRIILDDYLPPQDWVMPF